MEKITIDKEDWDKFVMTLDDPPEANDKLKELLKRRDDVYEIGYRDGGSNASAGWMIAISEHTSLEGDVTPSSVVEYINRLEEKLRQSKQS